VKLFDVFEIGGKKHEGVESRNCSQGILNQSKELNVIAASGSVGDCGRYSDCCAFDLLNEAVFLGFWQQFCESVSSRYN